MPTGKCHTGSKCPVLVSVKTKTSPLAPSAPLEKIFATRYWDLNDAFVRASVKTFFMFVQAIMPGPDGRQIWCMKVCVLQLFPTSVVIKTVTRREPAHRFPAMKWSCFPQQAHHQNNSNSSAKRNTTFQTYAKEPYLWMGGSFYWCYLPSVDEMNIIAFLPGPHLLLYDPPKELMKYVAHTESVSTPQLCIDRRTRWNWKKACSHLIFIPYL